MILAVTLNYVIGFKEKGSNGRFLPWKKMSTDKTRFSELTTNGIVIMGRKTWETLPTKFKPLPNRENWILTTDQDYTISGGLVFNSVEDILQYAKLNHPGKELSIIGGAEIYNLFQKDADEIHITFVECETTTEDAENLVVFTPDLTDFERVSEVLVPADENNEYSSKYVVFRRKEKVFTGASDVRVGC
jgi:dihydrofolate reductase